MKTCRKCNKEKQLDEFYTNKKGADGHLNKCKDCCKEWNKEHKEEILNYRKIYYKNNKEKSIKYYLKNRERCINKMKIYNDANKDKTKLYHVVNKEKLSIQKKIYYEANKEKNKGKYTDSMREYYINNKQKLLDYQIEYRKAKKLKLTTAIPTP